MKLIPITVIHTNGHRQSIHINIEQIVSVFKEGDSYFLSMSVNPVKMITKEDYTLILNWSNSGERAEYYA